MGTKLSLERLKEIQSEISNMVFIALSKLTDKNARANIVKTGEDLQKLIDEAIASQSSTRKVSEGLPPENELRNGMVLAWSTQLDEWQVENWGYVKDRPDDYTHWKPLPEAPKGE